MHITIEHLHKAFGPTVVCHDLQLDIHSGELLALLGPSGSGKTSLLRMIAGLELPDAGRILFDGRDVTHADARDRRIGFVFQHYALFPHMTVADNVAFGLRIQPAAHRPPRAEIAQRVQHLLEKVQLAELGRRYPHQLSGGQRQRVALARALATRPQVLLLDEPFGALDARVRKDLRRWLRQIHHDMGVTSIFVTHDQEEALEVADRVVVMNQGRIEQTGTPQQIYSQPASAFVMGFLGEVNILPPEQPGLPPRHIRPHDIQILPMAADASTPPPGPGAIPARWLRAHSMGRYVQVELVCSAEASDTPSFSTDLPAHTIQAHMAPHEYAQLQANQPLAEGSPVWLRARTSTVFA